MKIADPDHIRPSDGYVVDRIPLLMLDLPLAAGSGLFRPYVQMVPDVARHMEILAGNDVMVCLPIIPYA